MKKKDTNAYRTFSYEKVGKPKKAEKDEPKAKKTASSVDLRGGKNK